MNVQEIMDTLIKAASTSYKENVVRMGIPENNCIGVPITEIRKIARQIGKSNETANALWNTNCHEARLLAVLVFEPKKLTMMEIDSFMSDVISWDLCNHMCKHLIMKTTYCDPLIEKWVTSTHVYKKRAAFVLIGSLVIKHKDLSDETLDAYLTMIYEYSYDEHEHIRKGVAYALKEIGKKNYTYHEKAIMLAYEMLESNSKAQVWIAKNTIKELENMVHAEGRTRLISAHSKMGRGL